MKRKEKDDTPWGSARRVGGAQEHKAVLKKVRGEKTGMLGPAEIALRKVEV